MSARTVLCLATLLCAAAAGAADGDIDTSFGVFGTGHNVIAYDFGGNNVETLADVLAAADGSLYLDIDANLSPRRVPSAGTPSPRVCRA